MQHAWPKERPTTFRDETFEEWRSRMLRETSRFIEWGLKHPEQVEWIPKHPVGHAGFSERLKSVFWSMVTQNSNMPE